MLAPLKKSYDKPRQCTNKHRHYFADKGPYSQSCGFSSNHVWMCEVDHNKSWVPKNWCFELWFWRRLLRVPWTARRSNQSILKENQSWIFIGRTDARAEAAILWPPDVKSWLIGKNPEAGKYWRQEETGMTEDEMVGWHHQLYGPEFEQAPGVGDGQGGLVCCSPWVCKELDMTEWLDWTCWTSNFIREKRIFPEYLKRFKYLKLLAYVTNWIQVLHFHTDFDLFIEFRR